MLVLSRKSTERIQIGESIVITVPKIQSNAVRIGIDAPKEIPVLRTELLNVISETPAGRVLCSNTSESEQEAGNVSTR